MKNYMDVLALFGHGDGESYTTLERELAEEIVSLREHLEEDQRFRDGGDWCDLCDRPQWVEVDGSHSCASIRELHATIKQLEAKLREESLNTTIYGSR